jgi:hypothetical protein
MSTTTQIQEIIDSVKCKLTDDEYKTICGILQENTRKCKFYRLTYLKPRILSFVEEQYGNANFTFEMSNQIVRLGKDGADNIAKEIKDNGYCRYYDVCNETSHIFHTSACQDCESLTSEYIDVVFKCVVLKIEEL